MKKICLLYGNLEKIELEKDVVLVPYYLAKELGLKAEILCSPTDETVYTDRVEFVRHNMGTRFRKIMCHFRYLLTASRNIDVLMLFHATKVTFLTALIYKVLSNNKMGGGKIYLKLDSNSGREFSGNHIIEKIYYRLFWRLVDVFSVETTRSYHTIANSTIVKQSCNCHKLVLMPNGFDEVGRKKCGITVRSFNEKENLIITVGRLGTHQKNTQMLLRALKNVDLGDWRVKLVGPIDEKMRRELEMLRNECRSKENIEFSGAIYDKAQLMEYYSKAKVFVLTSEWESYGLVLNEARRFHDYIISTDVGAAKDIIQNKYGRLLCKNDEARLSKYLMSIVAGKTNIDVYNGADDTGLFYENVVKIVAERLR